MSLNLGWRSNNEVLGEPESVEWRANPSTAAQDRLWGGGVKDGSLPDGWSGYCQKPKTLG